MFRNAASTEPGRRGREDRKSDQLVCHVGVGHAAPRPKKIAGGAGKKRSDCIPHRSALFLLDGWVRIGKDNPQGQGQSTRKRYTAGLRRNVGNIGAIPMSQLRGMEK